MIYTILLGHLYVRKELQLTEDGDYEVLHCQSNTNFDRSTKLDVTTEAPIWDEYFWRQLHKILVTALNAPLMTAVILSKSNVSIVSVERW